MRKVIQRAITSRAYRDAHRDERKGVLGKIVGGKRVIETGRPGYHWITLDDGTIHEAINLEVSHMGGNEVRIVAKPNGQGVYEVIGLDMARALAALGTAATTAGSSPHSHNVPDTGQYDPVSSRRILEGLVYHRTGDPALTFRVYPFPYDNGRSFFSGGDPIDLTAYRPTSAFTQAWVKVGIDQATNQLIAARGTEYPNTDVIGYAELVATGLTGLALAGIRLTNGQTTVPLPTDFLDLRPGFGASSVGIDAILTDANGDVLSDANGDVLYE